MEYVNCGELSDYIVQKGKLEEDEARELFNQIVSGVEHCHNNGVVHGDLNPENIRLHSRGNVYGVSKMMRDSHFLKPICGSPNYAAPEVQFMPNLINLKCMNVLQVIFGNLNSSPEVEVWNCGVILYFLLCGTLPFVDESIPRLFIKIKDGCYTLPGHLSAGARDLIPRMLERDPVKRITIPEIRQHPWFRA